MRSRLIIIRGNSASGKTTIARRLQFELGYTTMLVSQDVIRRDILRVKDFAGNPAIELIYNTVMYGNKIGYDVVLEGILANKHYGIMLQKLIGNFEGDIFAYYLDIPFEETLKRHATKPNNTDYGEAEMWQWWNEADYLGVEQEVCFDESQTVEQILAQITRAVPARN